MPSPSPSPEQVAYTPRQAAVVAGLGHTSIRNAVNDGALPARRLGHRILILRDDLVTWLESLPVHEPKR